MMDERGRRIGLNEALFREVNEGLEDLNRAFATITHDMDLVCECGNVECVERIRMSLAEYERLRSNPERFAIVPGHEVVDVEEVVERHGAYDVVEKSAGAPAQVARETDPRDEDAGEERSFTERDAR